MNKPTEQPATAPTIRTTTKTTAKTTTAPCPPCPPAALAAAAPAAPVADTPPALHPPQSGLSRRHWLGAAAASPLGWALGLGAGLGASPAWAQAGAPAPPAPGRILVVLELSGGNDGLNTVVPYADDTYYRLRPGLGIRPQRLRKLDEHHGLNPGLAGFERLFKDGQLAIVHGCGYAQPSFSHFASMAFWHTAAPNSGEALGWLGRLADRLWPEGTPGSIVNIDETPSLAVRSRRHVPVVFDDPERFARLGPFETRALLGQPDAGALAAGAEPNPSRRLLHEVAASARSASEQVRQAWTRYRTPIDYGILPVDLPKVAALIAADYPARIYHVAYRHNAFDTHVHQAELHQRLLTYVSDGVSAFLRDMARIGRAQDVVLMAFSEFGRRAIENANGGTDHGTAGPMFIAGAPVRGGFYGQPVSLAGRGPDDNLLHTTDFRRVYATVSQGWLGAPAEAALLKGVFEPFAVFG